jgi:RNA polymerase sigma factor (TIGR02999 family)
MSEAPPVTVLLRAAGAGDKSAQGRLFDLAYHELKRIARGALRRNGSEQSLNPTSLVHEAYMKIAGGVGVLNDSTHFYSLFARAMRQVLLDLVRADATAKHGAGQRRVELTERLPGVERSLEELLQIDLALTRLQQVDPDLAELVEWHFFGGLSFVEIAAARGVTERTVRRHWEMARALLSEAIEGAG